MTLTRREKFLVVFFALSVLINLVWPFVAIVMQAGALFLALTASVMFLTSTILLLPVKDGINDEVEMGEENAFIRFCYSTTVLTMFIVTFVIVLVAQIWELQPTKRFAAALVSVVSPALAIIIMGLVSVDFSENKLSGFMFIGFVALYALSFIILLLRGILGLIGLVPNSWKLNAASLEK